MDDVQELRERTNPVFNTAKATLLQLAQAGNADAAMLAGRLGIDMSSVAHDDEQRAAMSGINIAILEARYGTMNALIKAAGAGTILDMPCGYTPRALEDYIADKRYIACDLPAVADEIGPLTAQALAERGMSRQVSYHGVDATNYASVRAALEGAEGPLCITTEGLLMYLTDSELAAVCDNIRRILEQFGGVWLTPDPETTSFYIAVTAALMGGGSAERNRDIFKGKADMGAVLKSMAGSKAQSALMASKNTFSGKADITFGNVLLLKGAPEQFRAAEAFLRSHGLKSERISLTANMPALRSLSREKEELMRRALEDVCVWSITLDESAPVRLAQVDSGAFGVDIQSRGGVLEAALRGRVDSISAPEFLAAYEKAAAACAPTDIRVDLSKLEYISSAGLRVLLMMLKAVKPGHVSAFGVNETVLSILEQTGYAELLTIC